MNQGFKIEFFLILGSPALATAGPGTPGRPHMVVQTLTNQLLICGHLYRKI